MMPVTGATDQAFDYELTADSANPLRPSASLEPRVFARSTAPSRIDAGKPIATRVRDCSCAFGEFSRFRETLASRRFAGLSDLDARGKSTRVDPNIRTGPPWIVG